MTDILETELGLSSHIRVWIERRDNLIAQVNHVHLDDVVDEW